MSGNCWVSIRDYLPTTGYLSAEVDGIADGLNQGRTSFSPGSTPHVLVHAGPGVIVSGVDASVGSLFPGARQVFQVEEDVVLFRLQRSRNRYLTAYPLPQFISDRSGAEEFFLAVLKIDCQSLSGVHEH